MHEDERDPDEALAAAERLIDEAEETDDGAAALPLYREGARLIRAAGRPLPEEALALLVHAENLVSVLLLEVGREEEAVAVARALVDEHFDATPDDVVRAMVNAALRVANAQREAGAADRSLELVERVLARFGRDDVPEAERTRVVADVYAGYALDDLGRDDEAAERFHAVLAWAAEHEAEIALDETLAGRARTRCGTWPTCR